MCRADRIPLAAQLSVAARRVASHRVASGPSLRQGYLRVSTGRRNPRYKSALLKLRCICFWTDVEKRRASSRDCRLSVCTVQISRAARSQALCPFAHIHVLAILVHLRAMAQFTSCIRFNSRIFSSKVRYKFSTANYCTQLHT